MKAVLASRAIEFPRTHNLALLLDMLADNGVPWPSEGEELIRLTPYGSHFRYDLPASDRTEGGPLERSWLRTCVRQTCAWAERLLAEQKKPPQKP
jgi:HEPN domain-containing protein